MLLDTNTSADLMASIEGSVAENYVPHPNNRRVAIAYSDAAFITAAHDPDYDAVLHKGFNAEAILQKLELISPAERSSFCSYAKELSPKNLQIFLGEHYPPDLAKGFFELGKLFQESTDPSRKINFKIAHTASVKPHTHFTANMTFPLGRISGTCFPGGEANHGEVLLIKPGFEHWTPANNPIDRQVVILSHEFKI